MMSSNGPIAARIRALLASASLAAMLASAGLLAPGSVIASPRVSPADGVRAFPGVLAFASVLSSPNVISSAGVLASPGVLAAPSVANTASALAFQGMLALRGVLAAAASELASPSLFVSSSMLASPNALAAASDDPSPSVLASPSALAAASMLASPSVIAAASDLASSGVLPHASGLASSVALAVASDLASSGVLARARMPGSPSALAAASDLASPGALPHASMLAPASMLTPAGVLAEATPRERLEEIPLTEPVAPDLPRPAAAGAFAANAPVSSSGAPVGPSASRDMSDAQPGSRAPTGSAGSTADVPATAPGSADGNAGPARAAAAGEAGAIAVTRVTLATGGLAHVEGRMTAPSEFMRLAIERPQVADVLRTLVVTGTVPVVSIDLPAAEPVGERSVTGRLLAGDLADPTTILTALIGETVILRGGANQLQGRLLAYSLIDLPAPIDPARPATQPAGPGQPPINAASTGLRVAVATADGRVAYATFPSVDQLAIEGDAVAERMAAVVPALGESVDDGRRELTVRLAEPGEAGFSFVVPTTVWRPSYRAMIGADGDVVLQGWGTLENTTGLDWTGIDLRLAVGEPVAYAQDVYAPLRTTRPSAPFEVGRTARIGIVAATPEGAFDDGVDFALMEAPSPAPSRMLRREPASALAAMPPAAELVTGAAATAGTASTIFNVAGRIDLAAGRTLTVPFLSGTQTVERVAYLDTRIGGNAMDALELAFDPEATVPGGLIAVYDADGFAGDARFAGAVGGETRLLPFAVSADLKVTTTDQTTSKLASARLADGSLIVTRSEVTRTAFRAEAAMPTVLIADLARASEDITEATSSAAEIPEVITLDTFTARLRAALPAGTTTVVVTKTQPINEYWAVGGIPPGIVEEVLAEGSGVAAETKARLREIGVITRRIADIRRRIETLDADIVDLREAVAIDRLNLEAIDVRTPEGASVRRRIIERTDRIDAGLEELRNLRREVLAEEGRLRG